MKVRSPLDPTGPEHEQIHGLTTAASTWVAASCGIAAGGALYFVAAFTVLTLLFVLRFGPRTSLTAHPSDSNLDAHARLARGRATTDPEVGCVGIGVARREPVPRDPLLGAGRPTHPLDTRQSPADHACGVYHP